MINSNKLKKLITVIELGRWDPRVEKSIPKSLGGLFLYGALPRDGKGETL